MKISVVFILLSLTSCSYFHQEDDRALARVDNEYLYESDLQGMVPPGTSQKDSLNLVRNYIESRVHRKALIHQSEKNLVDEQKNFSAQLDDYRNSLVVYAYENALVKQQLDTAIRDFEIENYYEQNQANFLLKDNIVRLSYVKIPLNSQQIKQFKRFFYSEEPGDKEKLADLCDRYATNYFLDNESWLFFQDVTKEIPIRTYNQEEFLRNRRTLEIEDSTHLFLVRFVDFRIKESISPLQFEYHRIKDIILNKRKIDLLNSMHQAVYEEALRNNTIEIY